MQYVKYESKYNVNEHHLWFPLDLEHLLQRRPTCSLQDSLKSIEHVDEDKFFIMNVKFNLLIVVLLLFPGNLIMSLCVYVCLLAVWLFLYTWSDSPSYSLHKDTEELGDHNQNPG